MPLTPNFSVSQLAGSPESFTVTDTSSGSDGAITVRWLYLLQADGTYLVPEGNTEDYIVWAYAEPSITLDLLSQDTALSITVEWRDGSSDLYDKTSAVGLDAFGQNFFYSLSDGQVPIVNPPVALSQDYYQNKLQFLCYLKSAEQAITYASDIQKAQFAYDLDQFMQNNQTELF
jgi:hypothetical protein